MPCLVDPFSSTTIIAVRNVTEDDEKMLILPNDLKNNFLYLLQTKIIDSKINKACL